MTVWEKGSDRYRMRSGDYAHCEKCGAQGRIVKHETRPGDAENTARRIARMLAKKEKASEVICLYKGPADERIPD
ncbi:MAG: hypothetical protein II680_05080, partial [Clostridia bacterium]|nr:hypothetical protein [Clostridia bacterium]